MKKILIVMLSVLLCLSLASCVPRGGAFKSKDFAVSYDYGTVASGKATALLDSSNIFFELDDWNIDSLIGGDVVTVRYKGEMRIQESYPSTVVTKDITLVSIFVTKADVMELAVVEGEGGVPLLQAKNPSFTPYFDTDKIMIINADLTYSELSASDIGKTLWASYRVKTGEAQANVAAVYSYCPRPIKETSCPFEWVGSESGHVKHMLCDCCRNDTGTILPHVNQDEDMKCDICGYDLATHGYALTMSDEDWSWLYEPLESGYKGGDEVSVKIRMATDTGFLFLVNGEDIAECRDVDGLYWEFTFVMPHRDTVIDFKTYDGFLPDANYARLIEAYYLKNPSAENVSIVHYYGEFSSGALVAMIDNGGGYDDALGEEIINGNVIEYINGNRITVLYENEFYTLTDAYNNGFITDEELESIADQHYHLINEPYWEAQ